MTEKSLKITGTGNAGKKLLSTHWTLSLVIIALLVLFDHKANSRDLDFYRIKPPEGINFNFVTGIAQAPDGLMWFATKNGLYRYDGNMITAFNPNPLNPNSLASITLESVFIDPQGIIWIGTLGYGLNRFDPKTERFTHYSYDPENHSGLSNDTVTKIISDTLGNLWIGTHGGLDKFIPGTGQFEHYRFDPDDPNSLSNNQVRSLFIDQQGVLWVGTGSPYPDNGGGPISGGLNRMDMETGTFTRFMNVPGDSTSLMNNKITAIYQDREGTLWIGTGRNGLHIFNRETGTFERLTYDPAKPGKITGPETTPETPLHFHITFLEEDILGNLWIGSSSSGILYFPEGKQDRYHFYQDLNTPHGFVDMGAWSIFTSRDGVLWLGGTSGNIYRINPIQKKIPRFKTPSPVNHFYKTPEGDLWIATEEKIIVKENRKGSTSPDTIDISPGEKDDDNVQRIMEDHEGNIWISGNNGLSLWKDQNERLISFRHDPQDSESLSHNVVIKTYEDRERNLWICTIHGLNLMDKKNGTFRHFFLNKVDTTIIGLNITTSALYDTQGNLWVGLWNGAGAYKLDVRENTSTAYLPGSNVIFLFEDSFGTIWAGTMSGLFRYRPETDAFVRFIDLSSTNSFFQVNTMLEDDQKYLWVSTSETLLRINPERDEVSRFGRTYGIENMNFSWNAGYKDWDGNLYFGHETGYLVLDPDDVMMDSRPPEISFIAFQLANQLVSREDQSVDGVDLLKEEEIRLRSDQNVFYIEYAIIDYSNPAENQLLFLLENFDNSWQKANEEGKTYYFNVPTGKYVFRVKAMNSYGLWSEKKINITILPPWWRTWWAYGLYAILFVLMIFGFDRFQRRRIKSKERQKAFKKELAQAKEIEKAYTELKATQKQLIQAEKMASLGELTAGIAHEIQNPLNFVNNFSEVNTELLAELKEELENGNQEAVGAIIEDIIGNEEKIIHHGKRADAIVKNMLQHSRGSGNEKIPTDLNALADEYTRLSYHGLRAKDKSFNADFKVDPDPGLPRVKVVPQDIGRVLLNLVNNAFHAVAERSKRGEAGYKPIVIVETRYEKGTAVIRVKDNGPGIPSAILEKIFEPFFTTKASGEGTGLGLSLSYDIITKGHGGELKLENKEGEGAEFVIQLPVKG